MICKSLLDTAAPRLGEPFGFKLLAGDKQSRGYQLEILFRKYFAVPPHSPLKFFEEAITKM